MEKLVLVVHILTALGIIGLILLQQGKGAEAGASFGAGASQTVFGSQGSGNFFSRLTAILATVFFATSFGLAVLASRDEAPDLDGVPQVPAAIESREQQDDVPAVIESDVPEVQDAAPAAGDLPAAEEAPQAELPEAGAEEQKTEEQPQ
ncbi:preprotein translocase subunit SecG [Microbulbifer harenosus]|uniref:Protein-export membrane protein SecG n=1 Tax=Microbulbifer harenosus TaxID=2576840 RepID=A0ABY2UPJ6_9GAMM|nr:MULTISPECIES: preprotein translocase subunit SecG [Microbulbifer]QIL89992.1 preprotein translocase subunit SecG [Microbulbifer sp. SH-1]TLM79871.1 preprotein translocase subunit SecG [Microbulbifer harenosus]